MQYYTLIEAYEIMKKGGVFRFADWNKKLKHLQMQCLMSFNTTIVSVECFPLFVNSEKLRKKGIRYNHCFGGIYPGTAKAREYFKFQYNHCFGGI